MPNALTLHQSKLAEMDKKWAEEIEPRLLSTLAESQKYLTMLEIPANPSAKSLAQMFSMVARAREYQNRVGSIYLEALKLLGQLNRMEEASKRAIKREVGDLIEANGDIFQGCRGADEKKQAALACVKRSQVGLIEFNDRAQELVSAAKTYFSSIQHINETILSVKQDLLTQLGIIKSMMMLGELACDPDAMSAFRSLGGDKDSQHRSPSSAYHKSSDEGPVEEGEREI